MNDEKIKKALECCFESQCHKCPMLGKHLCRKSLGKHALDFINQLQERIEELEILIEVAKCRKYYRKFIDEVFCKQKGNKLLEPDFDYIYQLYFEQQAEIEQLKSLCTSKDVIIKEQQTEIERLQNTIDDVLDREPLLVERAEKYAREEFAERLKKKKLHIEDEGQIFKMVHCYEIDNLLAEIEGEENA